MGSGAAESTVVTGSTKPYFDYKTINVNGWTVARWTRWMDP